jgi:uncharacterized membrane protein YbhN (UPF0104 family)
MVARARSLVWWCLRLAISVGILVLVASFVPVAQVVDTMKSARPGFVLGGWALVVLAFYVGAWSLRLLTDHQGVSISTLAILKVNLATQFYQLFLPGGFITGGIVRWYKITRHDNKPSEVLAAILLNRILQVWSLSFLAFGFWLLDRKAWQMPFVGALLGTILAMLCVLYLVSISRWAWRKFEALIGVLSFLPETVGEGLLKVSRSLAHFHSLNASGHAAILALALVRNLIRIASLVSFSYAFDLSVTQITLGWVRSFTQLVNLIPISYSGLGIREVSMIVLLKPYGVAEIAIVSLSMLWFSGLLFAAILGGLIEARAFFSRRRGRAPLAAGRLSGKD